MTGGLQLRLCGSPKKRTKDRSALMTGMGVHNMPDTTATMQPYPRQAMSCHAIALFFLFSNVSRFRLMWEDLPSKNESRCMPPVANIRNLFRFFHPTISGLGFRQSGLLVVLLLAAN